MKVRKTRISFKGGLVRGVAKGGKLPETSKETEIEA